MLQQLRREHVQMRRHVPNTSRVHLRRERTTETSQGVLAGKRLTPRTEASPNPFVTRETTITQLNTQTAAPTGSTLEWKDVLRQADTLFMRGEYEQALVWYHRGRRLRSKAREFQNGIAKCERAINNRCAMPQNTILVNGRESTVTMNSSEGSPPRSRADPSPPRSRASTRNTMVSSTHQTTRSMPTPQGALRAGGASNTPVSPWVTESENDVENAQDRKHVVKLKRDKMYLKDLLREMDRNVSGKSSDVQSIVEESLKYLDTRTKFWKQTLPVHALRSMQTRSFQFPVASLAVRDDSSLPSVNGSSRMKRGATSSNINHYVLREVFKVHQDFLDERYKECMSRAERCIQTVQIHKASEVGRKYEIVANLYALKGNSHFQLEQYKDALKCYHRDLDIAKEKDLTEARSRALENIGRVYARIGEFDKAVNVWKEKSALCRTDGERAWLYHEIGYCYLSKREYSKAKQFAEMAYASAEHTSDLVWQLNASALIAQAESRMGDLQNALDTFKYALDMAKLIGDRNEQLNIEEAMSSIKNVIHEDREERRRKQIETKNSKQRDGRVLPNGLILTDDDLNVDDDEYRNTPDDALDDASPSPQMHYQVPKGGKVRKRLYGQSDFSPVARIRKQPSPSDESGMESLSLSGISLKNKTKETRFVKHQPSLDIDQGAYHAQSRDPMGYTGKSVNIKGILKNTGPRNMWSDVDDAQAEHDGANVSLLPAIAKSNTQLGFVKPEIEAAQSRNNIQRFGVSHRTRDYQQVQQVHSVQTAEQQSKSVRFKSEDELFHLPDIPPPPPSESTVASEAEVEMRHDHPRILRAMLEAEGYFIGKYA